MNSVKYQSKLASLTFTGLFLASVTAARSAPATQPTTQPLVTSMLADIDTAYSNLQSAQFDGRITGNFDVRGEQSNHETTFTSTFASPNKFRHEAKDDALIISNGENVYSYLGRRDQYQTANVPSTKVASTDWPSAIAKILAGQNPSLMLAVSKSAAVELNALSKIVTIEQPTLVDGISYATLRFDIGADHQIVTILVDPSKHLLRRVTTDYVQPLQKSGASDVKRAQVTIDYTQIQINTPIVQNQFSWTAPAGSALVTTVQPVMMDDDATGGAKELVGKTAPDFTLKLIDGKDVKLSDLKGNVVILDIWATWCGPCVASLPHLNDLYGELSPKGLKVIAMNLQEDADTVKAFVEKKKWTLPIALDTDGAVGQKYKANAIPETVVVGKDGTVKQVFIGSGNEDDIRALVTKEMQ